MTPGRIAIAATTFACMTLVSFGWSEQRGVSLSIASAQAEQAKNAQAQTKRPQASRHMAASSQRHGRRVVRGYGRNPVAAGADLAAGAVDTAGAVAAGAIAATPFGGTYAAGPGWDSGGYYAPSTWGDFDCRPGYAGCRPSASKDWVKDPLR